MNQMWVKVFEAVQVAIWVLLAHLDPPHFLDGQGLILVYWEYPGFCSINLAFAMGGGQMGCAQKCQCFLSVFQQKCVNSIEGEPRTRHKDASTRIGGLVGTIHRFGNYKSININ